MQKVFVQSYKIHLIFTRYSNSYRVDVVNLEKLSVEQIKQLQKFVELRRGIFDFETYRFSIQKKLDFLEFVKLLKQSGIDAVSQEHIIIKESKPRIEFGQYKGMEFSELPDSYLLWLKTNYRGAQRDTIEDELKKRKISS